MKTATPNKSDNLSFWLLALPVVGVNFLPMVMAPTWPIVQLAMAMGMCSGSIGLTVLAWRTRSLGFRFFLIGILLLPTWAIVGLKTWNWHHPLFYDPRCPTYPRSSNHGL